MFYAPLISLFMLAFFGLLVLLFLLIMVGAVSYAFDKIGLDPIAVFALFSACLIGSYINIPVHRLRNDAVMMDQVVSVFGFRFRIPTSARRETVLAVNVGGAIIPCFIAFYLLAATSHPFQALIGSAVVTGVSKWLARYRGWALPCRPLSRRSLPRWWGCFWPQLRRQWWPISLAPLGC